MCNSYINVGDTYGYLTVLKEVGKNKDNRKLWLCQCECGNKRKISSRYVKQGRKCGACGLDLDENNKVHNKYVFFDQYIIGYTSNGDKFYIDIDDYEIVYPYCWHKMNNGYICTKPGKDVFSEEAYNQENIKKKQFIRNINEVINKYTNNITVQDKFSIKNILQELQIPDKCLQYIEEKYKQINEVFN